LNAKVSEKRDIVSDFQLKYFNEMPAPPAATPTPGPAAEPRTPKPAKTPVAKGHPPQKPGPIISPVPVERPIIPTYVLRRVTAVCGSGDATISVASFGGTVRLKKL
jgi:hypothetical protein